MDPSLLKPIIDVVKPNVTELTKAAVKRRGETKDLVISALHEKFAAMIQDADPDAIAQRMIKRQEYMNLRKQLNYENVIELALELASETPSDCQRSLEEDWFAQWFSAVEEVSDTEMQKLWARAFAHQQDKSKRQVSLRALDSLRLMERNDVCGFHRAVELFSFFGYIFGASQEIIDGMMSREALNALLDLGLISHEETMVRSVAMPGGYLLRLNADPGTYAPDPIHVFKLSPRGLELASTLPDDIEMPSRVKFALDTTNRLCVAKYINMIARGLGDIFSITLCVYEPTQERPPKGGQKRTHAWDKADQKWVRKESLDFDYDQEVLDALESGNP